MVIYYGSILTQRIQQFQKIPATQHKIDLQHSNLHKHASQTLLSTLLPRCLTSACLKYKTRGTNIIFCETQDNQSTKIEWTAQPLSSSHWSSHLVVLCSRHLAPIAIYGVFQRNVDVSRVLLVVRNCHAARQSLPLADGYYILEIQNSLLPVSGF